MWAYIAAYELPASNPDAQAHRVHLRYPVQIDRVLGLGQVPSLRLQRRFHHRGRLRPGERVLVWAHWLWFAFPHATLLAVMLRSPERFAAAAARMYAVFDLGVVFYWVLPTAPPWYAAARGLLDDGNPIALRRLMIEYGEEFWRGNWRALYGSLAGNPLAAMPSLHFATSVMGAHLLAEQGAVEGGLGWTYAATLGLALVYLGEHYVIDLLAGLALAEGVRRAAPRVSPVASALASAIERCRPRPDLSTGD
jgi:membrane-associated phospholipid phosphatase